MLNSSYSWRELDKNLGVKIERSDLTVILCRVVDGIDHESEKEESF